MALCVCLAACGSSTAVPPDAPSTTLGGDRPVELDVPPSIQPGQRYPLVLVLHGYGATGLLQKLYFGLRDASKNHGVFVLAPDGLVDQNDKQFWNADPACCDFFGSGVDDVAYLGGLIDQVRAQWPIDPKRIYVIGHSNGAFMAYRLACERADVITAMVGLAGAAASTPSSCAPTQKLSVLHVHGTADDTIAYDGGTVAPGVTAPGAIASVAQWAGYLGCTGARTDTGTLDLTNDVAGAETTTSSTGGCPAGAAADLWTMTDAGHIPSLSVGFQTALWAWLDAHPRP